MAASLNDPCFWVQHPASMPQRLKVRTAFPLIDDVSLNGLATMDVVSVIEVRVMATTTTTI